MEEETYLEFENYLANEMSLEEKINFENKLENDTNLKNKLELYKETTQFLKVKFSSETSNFKENLESISNNHFTASIAKKPKVISLQSKWFAVAAMFLVFIGVWFFNQQNNPTYSDFNQHENANFVVRGSVVTDLKDAEIAFNAKDYALAVGRFEKILQENSSPEIQLYYAISLLETGKTKQAEAIFIDLKNGTSVYSQKAIWYLALTKLKEKDFDACSVYLKQISEDSEEYQKAQRLLNDLD
jgi:predicted Zn-dependent protease